jgi:thiamine biosynthesis protein ThiC
MESLKEIRAGLKCSVVIEQNGKFVRRNGIVQGKIGHLKNCWCIELNQYPFFTKAYEEYHEILEPMTAYENLINVLDELKN